MAQRAGTLHRNFQGYTTQAGASLYAFGISSISATETTYRQNHKGLAEWRAALGAGRLPVERGMRLTPEDLTDEPHIANITEKTRGFFDHAGDWPSYKDRLLARLTAREPRALRFP